MTKAFETALNLLQEKLENAEKDLNVSVQDYEALLKKYNACNKVKFQFTLKTTYKGYDGTTLAMTKIGFETRQDVENYMVMIEEKSSTGHNYVLERHLNDGNIVTEDL